MSFFMKALIIGHYTAIYRKKHKERITDRRKAVFPQVGYRHRRETQEVIVSTFNSSELMFIAE
jgi:hypothetical protein